jgi:hypothetical protein
MMTQLRVWWVPQVPMGPFYKEVPNLITARLLLDTLAAYDSFQYETSIKPDYANAGGLEEFDGEQWFEWYDDDGFDIDEYSIDENGEIVCDWENDNDE